MLEETPPIGKDAQLSLLKDGTPLEFKPPAPGVQETDEERSRRTLKASVLMRLIGEFPDGVAKPVTIKNAVIEGKLEARYAVFKGEVSIVDSEFTQHADFSSADFGRNASFEGSRFNAGVDFRGAHAAYDLCLTRAALAGVATFDDVKVDETFRAEGACFGDVSFVRAKFAKEVRFDPHAPKGSGAGPGLTIFAGKSDFTDAHVGGIASFEGAHFGGRAHFIRAHFGSTAYFTCFYGRRGDSGTPLAVDTTFEHDANFDAVRIDGNARFEGTQFRGRANFERARIGGHALFRALEFDEERAAVPVRFSKEVNFLGAQIEGNAEFYGATFNEAAYFERMVVGHNAAFNSFHDFGRDIERPHKSAPLVRTQFLGLADFLGCHVKGSFEFTGVQFTGRAWFEGIQVEGNAYFDELYIRDYGLYDEDQPSQPLYIRDLVGGVRFGGKADFINARFMRQANFRYATFSRSADFTNTEVHGKAVFERAKFGADAKVQFTSANFKNQADFRHAHFGGEADLTDLVIDGAAFFCDARFDGPLVLRAARFKTLDLQGASFVARVLALREGTAWASDGAPELVRKAVKFAFSPKRRWVWYRVKDDGRVDMRGFTYEHIKVDSVQALLECIDPYDRQPYTVLEKALRSTGLNREADQVFFEANCREGQDLRDRVLLKKGTAGRFSWERVGDAVRAAWNLVQGFFFRHGVRPIRLVLFCLGMLALGFTVFWQDGALERKKESPPTAAAAPTPTSTAPPAPAPTPAIYDAINVSIRQSVPLVEIPVSSEWVPSNKAAVVPYLGTKLCAMGDCFTAAGYAGLHRVIGFLMIPVGVAALAGLLHRRDRGGR